MYKVHATYMKVIVLSTQLEFVVSSILVMKNANKHEVKLTFFCSNSTIETIEKGVYYVQI